MYKEYLPNILLSPYIETYWVSNGYKGEQTIRILPDGCVDILFNLDSVPQDNIKPFLPYIIGTMTTYSDVIYKNAIRMMGIRFRPCGISAFTRVPINEFTNIKVDLSLFETIFDVSFYEQLPEIENEVERICYIDTYLVKILKKTFSIDKQLIYAVDFIRQTKGVLPINDVLNIVCLCQRQFERKFKATTGITPKMFSSIIRFANTKEVLCTSTSESLFSIALEYGYYDHAHLIREYKRFAGNLPIR